MNKILILIGSILGTMLIIVNFAASVGPDFTFTGWGPPWMLALNGMISGMFLGYGLKGYLSERGNTNFEDEDGVNF